MNNSATENKQSIPADNICAACNFENEKNNVFCDNCGKPLHIAAPTEAGGFSQNVPPTMAGAFSSGQQAAGSQAAGSQAAGSQAAGSQAAGSQAAGSQAAGSQAAGSQAAIIPVTIKNIPVGEWANYIGSLWQAYVARFIRMEQRNTNINFSISAFFLGPFYFAYRKMFPQTIIALLIFVLDFIPTIALVLVDASSPLLSNINPTTLGKAMDVLSIFIIVSRVAMSFFADFWYKEKISKDILKARAARLAGPAYQEALRKKGGTSVVALLCVVAIALAFVLVISYIWRVEILAFYEQF